MKKHLIIKNASNIIVITIIFLFTSLWSQVASAAEEAKMDIEVSFLGNYTITNAEGEVLNYKCGEALTGNLRVYETNGPTPGSKNSMITISVAKSSSFRIVNNEKTKSFVGVWGWESMTNVEAQGEDSIIISTENKQQVVSVRGTGMSYLIQIILNTGDHMVYVSGYAASSFTVREDKEKLRLEGVSGRLSIEDWDTKKSFDTIKNYDLYALNTPIILSDLGTSNMKATGALKLPAKEYPAVQVLHARKTADPDTLLLYWGKVKKAKGYRIYRYSPTTQKYKKIATISGKANRAWVDKGLTAGKVYRYKVSYYTLKGEKKIESKKSYWVKAVTQDDLWENVTRVAVNKSKITGKKGKTVKLKATLITVPGKKVLDSTIRWYTMNKKVATVDSKGLVRLKKKGTCYLYAKAHDGINSKKVKVVVK